MMDIIKTIRYLFFVTFSTDVQTYDYQMSPLYTTWKNRGRENKEKGCIGREEMEERMIEGKVRGIIWKEGKGL